MSKTKDELERENAQLHEQNEQLHGLVAAIRAAIDVPQGVYEHRQLEHDEYTRRAAYMRGALAAFDEHSSSARAAAATIAGLAAGPVTYRVYKPEPAPADDKPLDVAAGADPFAIPANRIGEADSVVEAEIYCGETSRVGTSCNELDGHPLPHEDVNGHRWGWGPSMTEQATACQPMPYSAAASAS